ncbi:hypothetical protein LINPERPRIM_LOCUS17333 [Linum perenne]
MASGFSLESHLAFALGLAILFSKPYLSSSFPKLLPVPEDGDYNDMPLTESERKFELHLNIIGGSIVLLAAICTACACVWHKCTIAMVQVVLSARAGDVGIVLYDIAKRSPKRESTLKETVNTLLGHQQSILYGSAVTVTRGLWITESLMSFAEKQAKKQGIGRRVLLDNHKIVPKPIRKQAKDYTLVTIMAFIDGAQTLATIVTREDMKEALNFLITDSDARIVAGEVIWAHRDPLSMGDVLESYPDLKAILS